jgi:hypothetical protein
MLLLFSTSIVYSGEIKKESVGFSPFSAICPLCNKENKIELFFGYCEGDILCEHFIRSELSSKDNLRCVLFYFKDKTEIQETKQELSTKISELEDKIFVLSGKITLMEMKLKNK